MKFIEADGKSEVKFLKEMRERTAEADQKVSKVVSEILKNVRINGDKALKTYGETFDGGFPSELEINKEDMKKAYDEADESFKNALENAAKNIRIYHQRQVQNNYELSNSFDNIKDKNDIVLGQIIRGLSKVGIYVPGGTAAYPSTVLMNAIPAKIAKVEELIMVTPPMISECENNKKRFSANPDILTAAYISGVDRVFLTGGAQGIGALAYGTETIPRVDKIVGPGNVYVAEAKRQVFGAVDIDMVAGPSEILIIADDTGNPKYIAADLLSQAEHDKMAAAILLTTSQRIAEETDLELEKQMTKLSRRDIVKDSLKNFGAVLLCRDVEQMFEMANEIAPEHLEIMMKAPLSYLEKVKNAGSVFLGNFAPEPLGDYYSGTNHVLPTSGTARFSSPLGVYSFVKKMSYTYYSEEALETAKEDIIKIAEREGLTAHAEAVRIRYEGK